MLRNAIVHQWQAAGYLLASMGLLLGLDVATGRLWSDFLFALALALALALPTVLALRDLHRRHYRLGAVWSAVAGVGCGTIALGSVSGVPAVVLLAGSPLAVLVYVAIYLAIVSPLGLAGLAGVRAACDLGTVADGTRPKRPDPQSSGQLHA
jgi:hypothetical protein